MSCLDWFQSAFVGGCSQSMDLDLLSFSFVTTTYANEFKSSGSAASFKYSSHPSWCGLKMVLNSTPYDPPRHWPTIAPQQAGPVRKRLVVSCLGTTGSYPMMSRRGLGKQPCFAAAKRANPSRVENGCRCSQTWVSTAGWGSDFYRVSGRDRKRASLSRCCRLCACRLAVDCIAIVVLQLLRLVWCSFAIYLPPTAQQLH